MQPSYQLSTGQALATFADGSPAVVHNRFGQGEAYLVGFNSITCTGGYHQEIGEPVDAAAKRRIVSLAARGHVEPHAVTQAPRTLAFVSDGDDLSMLFVVHCYDQPQEHVTVNVTLPRTPQRAYDGEGNDVPFERIEGGARVTFDFAVRDVRMVVFK